MTRTAASTDVLTLIDQAREATRDLRAAMKDLKLARQEAEAAIATLMEVAVVDALDAVVKREVAVMGEQFRQATAAATARVAEVCAELYERYLRGETRAGVSLPEVFEARQTLRKWQEETARNNGVREIKP